MPDRNYLQYTSQGWTPSVLEDEKKKKMSFRPQTDFKPGMDFDFRSGDPLGRLNQGYTGSGRGDPNYLRDSLVSGFKESFSRPEQTSGQPMPTRNRETLTGTSTLRGRFNDVVESLRGLGNPLDPSNFRRPEVEASTRQMQATPQKKPWLNRKAEELGIGNPFDPSNFRRPGVEAVQPIQQTQKPPGRTTETKAGASAADPYKDRGDSLLEASKWTGDRPSSPKDSVSDKIANAQKRMADLNLDERRRRFAEQDTGDMKDSQYNEDVKAPPSQTAEEAAIGVPSATKPKPKKSAATTSAPAAGNRYREMASAVTENPYMKAYRGMTPYEQMQALEKKKAFKDPANRPIETIRGTERAWWNPSNSQEYASPLEAYYGQRHNEAMAQDQLNQERTAELQKQGLVNEGKVAAENIRAGADRYSADKAAEVSRMEAEAKAKYGGWGGGSGNPMVRNIPTDPSDPMSPEMPHMWNGYEWSPMPVGGGAGGQSHPATATIQKAFASGDGQSLERIWRQYGPEAFEGFSEKELTAIQELMGKKRK